MLFELPAPFRCPFYFKLLTLAEVWFLRPPFESDPKKLPPFLKPGDCMLKLLFADGSCVPEYALFVPQEYVALLASLLHQEQLAYEEIG